MSAARGTNPLYFITVIESKMLASKGIIFYDTVQAYEFIGEDNVGCHEFWLSDSKLCSFYMMI